MLLGVFSTDRWKALRAMRPAKLATLTLAALLLGSASANAITVKKRIEAPGLPPRIWGVAGDFCAIRIWHPAVASCEETREGSATFRTLTLKDGGKIKEKLSRTEDLGYSSEIVESTLPVKNYKSKLWVEFDDEPDRTAIYWQSDFNANGASAAEAQKRITDLLYEGVKGIKRISIALHDGEDPTKAFAEAPAAVAQTPPPERPQAITVEPPVAPDHEIAKVTPQLPQTAADADRRIALVIGNDRYESLPPLQKAVNDARAVGEGLTKLGFEVLASENATRRTINTKLVEFANKVREGDIAFFFFAGHGVEVGGVNYLLGVDSPQASEGEEGLITGEGIAANAVVDQMQEHGAKVAMLVLDACRDNPFKTAGRGIGGTRGLTMMRVPTGVFVLYSAGEGQAALDRLNDNDPSPNSVFTRTFVELLGQPGLTLHDIAKKTQSEVYTLAQSVRHTQLPAYDDRIIGELTLHPGNQ